jgi:hypothetical protein
MMILNICYLVPSLLEPWLALTGEYYPYLMLYSRVCGMPSILDAVGFRIRIALGEISSRGGLHRLPVRPGRFPGVVPIEVDRFAHNPRIIAVFEIASEV